MVESADGSATLNGRSGGLSSEGDRQLFAILRSLADVILAGAGTVRAEKYRAVRPGEVRAALREGRAPTPPIAVVTRAMDLDLSSPLFTAAAAHARTILITVESAPAGRRSAAARVADVIVAGTDRVDLKIAVAALAERGHQRILAEGGPHLLGQLAAAGLVDELCLTISPVLAAGDTGRIVAGGTADAPAPLHLAHILEDNGYLLCRYLTPP
jgi:riboflavin biosynthesis pyrimidine reductase